MNLEQALFFFCKLEEICPFVLGVGATHSSSDDPRNQQEIRKSFAKSTPSGLCSCFRGRGQGCSCLVDG